MLAILWWKLTCDESYLVMKVMIVKEVMTGDVSPVAMFKAVQLFKKSAIWFSENSSVLVGLPFPNQHPLINPFISLLIPISHSLRRGGVQERVPLSRVTLPCYPTTLICPREENIWETSRWKIYFSTNVLFGFTILDWMAVWLQRPCLVSIKSWQLQEEGISTSKN